MLICDSFFPLPSLSCPLHFAAVWNIFSITRPILPCTIPMATGHCTTQLQLDTTLWQRRSVWHFIFLNWASLMFVFTVFHVCFPWGGSADICSHCDSQCCNARVKAYSFSFAMVMNFCARHCSECVVDKYLPQSQYLMKTNFVFLNAIQWQKWMCKFVYLKTFCVTGDVFSCLFWWLLHFENAIVTEINVQSKWICLAWRQECRSYARQSQKY